MQLPIRLINAGQFVQIEKYRTDWTPLRTTQYWELEYHRTIGAIGRVDGQSIAYGAGRILTARPGQMRQSFGLFVTDYLRIECTDDAFRETYLNPLPLWTMPPDAERWAIHFQAIADAYLRDDAFSAAEIYGHIFTLLAELNRCRQLHRAVDPELARAQAYICAHFSEPLTLAHIAAQVPLSPNHFWTRFKCAYGITPLEQLQRTRITEAKKRLQMTDEPITAVAAACGYESPSYFAQVFRARVGCTPSRFRERFRIRMG